MDKRCWKLTLQQILWRKKRFKGYKESRSRKQETSDYPTFYDEDFFSSNLSCFYITLFLNFGNSFRIQYEK